MTVGGGCKAVAETEHAPVQKSGDGRLGAVHVSGDVGQRHSLQVVHDDGGLLVWGEFVDGGRKLQDLFVAGGTG